MAGKVEASAGSRRIKICVTGLRGVPGVMGGVETHCEELYPRLKRLMPDADIEIVGRSPYMGSKAYDFEGVRVTPLHALRHKYFEAISNTLLAVFYARFRARADVLHMHAIGPGLLTPLAKLLGLKAVVTHHGQDYRRQKWNRAAKAVLAAGEWLAAASADRVLIVSQAVRQELAQRHPRRAGKLVYVPNGAPALAESEPGRAADAEVLARFGLAKDGYVLGVGRLVPEKGFHDLLDAFAAAGANLKLVIAGAADHEDDYSQSLLRRAGKAVVFTGFLGRDELGALYRNAAVFVLPSYHEGLPIVVLEAARHGAPLLLSDIAANREIGLDQGNYFPVGDVGALESRLRASFKSLRADPEAIAARFDWDKAASRTAEVYRELAKGG